MITVEVQREEVSDSVLWQYDISPGKSVEEHVHHARSAFLHWDP